MLEPVTVLWIKSACYLSLDNDVQALMRSLPCGIPLSYPACLLLMASCLYITASSSSYGP